MNKRKKTLLIIISLTMILITLSLHEYQSTQGQPIESNQQHQFQQLMINQNNSQNISIISNSIEFDSKTQGSISINISGNKNDIQNVRINLSWNPTIVNLTKINYNNHYWPLSMKTTSDQTQGYFSFHLYNFTNGNGVNLNGELQLAKLYFKAAETLKTDACSNLIFTEHHLTTGSHEDIICNASTETTICVNTTNETNTQLTQTNNQNLKQNEESYSPMLLFLLIIITAIIIGTISIIIIIKK